MAERPLPQRLGRGEMLTLRERLAARMYGITPPGWRLTGVHGSPCALRLAYGHGPVLPTPDEEIAVVVLGSWAAVRAAIAAALTGQEK